MTAHNASSHIPVNAPAQAAKSRHRHGLLTPDTTPAPEDARIAADKERSPREPRQQGAMPPITEISEGGEDQPQIPYDIGSQDDHESESDSDGREGALAPTEAQVNAVSHVLACYLKDYHNIMGLGPVAEDARQERENIVNRFNHMVCQVHPRSIKVADAHKALKCEHQSPS